MEKAGYLINSKKHDILLSRVYGYPVLSKRDIIMRYLKDRETQLCRYNDIIFSVISLRLGVVVSLENNSCSKQL